MSTPGDPTPPTDKGKGKEPSFPKKVLTRVKTFAKYVDPKKRLSFIGGSSSKAVPTAAAESSQQPMILPAAAYPDATRVPRAQIYEERAKRLVEKCGLEIKPSEWHSTTGHVLRVDKPVRMRVHHVCHECKATFGAARECPSCNHPRCSQCTRYPPRRTAAELQASRERRAAVVRERQLNPPIQVDYNMTTENIPLTKPSKIPGGQDLVYRKPRQRIRRFCCECDNVFLTGQKICASCNHIRCTECPRDPSKKDRYPYGYPGDSIGPKSTPYYSCHACTKVFPANSADETPCESCGHRKCSKCEIVKPRKVDPEPDPDILASVRQKLGELKVG